MAMRGKVVNKSPNYSTGEVLVTIDYFDDVDPTAILHQETFSFPAWNSLNELAAQVRAVGTEERRKRVQVDGLLDAINVGAEIAI